MACIVWEMVGVRLRVARERAKARILRLEVLSSICDTLQRDRKRCCRPCVDECSLKRDKGESWSRTLLGSDHGRMPGKYATVTRITQPRSYALLPGDATEKVAMMDERKRQTGRRIQIILGCACQDMESRASADRAKGKHKHKRQSSRSRSCCFGPCTKLYVEG